MFWLPHYCPELNLIERLWRHLKGSRVANVLFATFGRFARHLEGALADFAAHPDLTLALISPARVRRIRKNLVGAT